LEASSKFVAAEGVGWVWWGWAVLCKWEWMYRAWAGEECGWGGEIGG
jgi:hypothetical protein